MRRLPRRWCGFGLTGHPNVSTAAPRSRRDRGTYRIRKDPFEAVWDEVCQWLAAQPERNGRSVFDELRQRYPGQFANGQMRTLAAPYRGLAGAHGTGVRRRVERRGCRRRADTAAASAGWR